MNKGKPVIDYEKCMCCTICIYACPFGSLEKTDIKRKSITDSAPKLKMENNCNGCGICKGSCPIGAIEIK